MTQFKMKLFFVLAFLCNCCSSEKERITSNDNTEELQIVKTTQAEQSNYKYFSLCDSLKSISESVSDSFIIKNVDHTALQEFDISLFDDSVRRYFHSVDATTYLYGYTNFSPCSLLFYERLIIDDVTERIIMVNFNAGGKVESVLLVAEHERYAGGANVLRSWIDNDTLVALRITRFVGDYIKSEDNNLTVTDSIVSKYRFFTTGEVIRTGYDSARYSKLMK